MKTLIVLSVLSLCNAFPMPSSFTKCDKRKPDFNECLSEAVRNAIGQLVKPMEKYHLPSFEPFQFASLSPKSGVQGGSSSTVVKFRNYRIYGRTKIDSSKAKMNFEDNTLTLELSHPEIRYEFDYEAKGKMFVLPFDSAGHGTVTLKNPIYTIKFTLEEYVKDNKKYLRVVDSNMTLKPESMTMYFENLFKNKVLNDAFNREMSESWKVIFANFSAGYMDSYAKVYGDVFNNFLEVVPLVDLFEGVQ
ncbi:hypothetical protein MTP99_007455 [Tenebrio molitor]|jgi:hypothetical protein|uniref:protein takeout-like n=1 Tax=Tenebrio molitor TaxID=7067 RepID=UPI0027023BBC|nr:hypothetical protein MTP99_007455 [Tenebrio molitor]